ncbi:protein disulfide oxidoreductase [Fervidicoccus fontis]|uniref:Glutaredoxin-like domain protein n=2 Tax=Fervidicoccus fontis TaxID=683846 RepID=H9ZZJ5_FERFK|nr:thioredoxin family protein [Fervidicoccus fontis]AFH42152.1 glutaredoxin-like domain protein [Fervidicoccus fontis Kam940]
MSSEEETSEFNEEHPMVPGGELDEETLEALEEALRDMASPVIAEIFVKESCYYCQETIKLLSYFREKSPSVNGKKLFDFVVYDKEKDVEKFKQYGISRTPTVTLVEGRIRYTGIPSGEEIRSLVETIIRISQNDSGLEESSKQTIKSINRKVYIEVIITPSCPYCPYAALLANMIAFESYKSGNKSVIADTVEAYENPDIADKYNVMSVPVIAINGEVAFVGLPYEVDFVEKVKELS